MSCSITSTICTEQYAKKSPIMAIDGSRLQSTPEFILCERCYWCATYLDNNRALEEGLDDDKSKICPQCDAIDCLTSLPILFNESFTFNYTVKRGIELEFRKRVLRK
jgi:hypothetical protein